MTTCRICDKNFEPFISFGDMPIANGFLAEKDFSDEYFFGLATGFCEHCNMVQLIDQPAREMMFHDEYAFFSSLSSGMRNHFAEFAEKLQAEFLISDDPFAVEIGSNDGIMLKNIAQAGIRHLGVEPSANVAQVASDNGVNTISSFFDEALAAQIIADYGHADTITSANVICHIPYLHSVFAGIETLLKPTGVFIYEDPYLGDIVEKVSYDQIYDEHVFFFSVMSVSKLAAMHNMEVFDVEHLSTHGGSMRYYIAKKGSHPISENVARQLQKEQQLGLDQANTYDELRKRIEKSRTDLVAILEKIKAENGKPVVAYGATSKSTTVTNYCGIGPDLIDYICDTTPLKQGKFSPGSHIPVKPYEDFLADYPDYTLLFAWNHSKEIMAKEEGYNKHGGKWIVYVREVKIT